MARLGLRNAFNPSPLTHSGRDHLAIRALGPDGSKPFHAYYLQVADGLPQRVVDLSETAAAHGVPVVADPKLVVLDDRVFATFNTGFAEGQNEVFLLAVWPDVGRPQRVTFAGRRAVEKNWGFFWSQSRLFCIYSLEPTVVLGLVGGELGGGGALQMDRLSTGPAGAPRWAIGPQPWHFGADLVTIVHQKIHLRGRRGYVGRPVRIRDPLGARPRVEVSARWLIDSWASFAPTGERHNHNLLFATYFSGGYMVDDRVVLGAGVNDLASRFAEFRVTDLWR